MAPGFPVSLPVGSVCPWLPLCPEERGAVQGTVKTYNFSHALRVRGTPAAGTRLRWQLPLARCHGGCLLQCIQAGVNVEPWRFRPSGRSLRAVPFPWIALCLVVVRSLWDRVHHEALAVRGGHRYGKRPRTIRHDPAPRGPQLMHSCELFMRAQENRTRTRRARTGTRTLEA